MKTHVTTSDILNRGLMELIRRATAGGPTSSSIPIAQTIFQQIGGGRALFMLGTPKGALTIIARGLLFKIRGCKKINIIQIELAGNDTYTVKFRKVTAPRLSTKTWTHSKGTDKTVNEFSGIQADGLVELIESTTGLHTSL